MADRELPVMTDEQVDVAFRVAHPARFDGLGYGVNRQHVHWLALRAAFPAPRPPRPQGEWFSVGQEGYYVVVHYEEIIAGNAPAALAELQACVDWITEEARDVG